MTQQEIDNYIKSKTENLNNYMQNMLFLQSDTDSNTFSVEEFEYIKKYDLYKASKDLRFVYENGETEYHISFIIFPNGHSLVSFQTPNIINEEYNVLLAQIAFLIKTYVDECLGYQNWNDWNIIKDIFAELIVEMNKKLENCADDEILKNMVQEYKDCDCGRITGTLSATTGLSFLLEYIDEEEICDSTIIN